MQKSFHCALPGRSIIAVTGTDATRFLQGIVTCDVENLLSGQAAFGALLTPQGKILFDFFVIAQSDGYWLDVAADQADALIKRLGFYRLRAKVDLSLREDLFVEAVWGSGPAADGSTITDPRLPAMGWRRYLKARPEKGTGDYQAHRIALGMPEGGSDFEFGDAFPHEALMDQFHGVDFHKGCFVGQEVVARMQHRGTARKRIVKISAAANLPDIGTQISADGKPAGKLGSSAGRQGLAMLRLDRAASAMASGAPLLAGDVEITASLQDFVSYGWPEATV